MKINNVESKYTDLVLSNNSMVYITDDIVKIVKQKVYLFLTIMTGERLFNRSKSFGILSMIGENLNSNRVFNMQTIFNTELANIDPYIEYVQNSAQFVLIPDNNIVRVTFSFYIKPIDKTENVSMEIYN